MAMREMVEARVACIDAYRALTGVLARLAQEGSNYACMAWDRLPAQPPIQNQSQLAIALHVARDGGPLDALAFSEAAPEWLAYRATLWTFSQAPIYGPPPMYTPPDTVAACCHKGCVQLVMHKKHGE